MNKKQFDHTLQLLTDIALAALTLAILFGGMYLVVWIVLDVLGSSL